MDIRATRSPVAKLPGYRLQSIVWGVAGCLVLASMAALYVTSSLQAELRPAWSSTQQARPVDRSDAYSVLTLQAAQLLDRRRDPKRNAGLLSLLRAYDGVVGWQGELDSRGQEPARTVSAFVAGQRQT